MTTSTTTATPASTIADLSPEALDSLTARLRRVTGREDVEVLAVTGVRRAHVNMGMYTEVGLGFEVAFTYTTGRRQRRLKTVAWPINVYPHPGERDENLPACLWVFLAAAVAAHGQPA